MITPKVVTAPTVEPVSQSEMREHLRITSLDDNSLLARQIKAAREYFEWRTSRTIHQTTYDYVLKRFPAGDLVLPRSTPLISITSIKYKDSDGTETTWSSAEYVMDTYNEPGCVVPAYGESWPSFTPYPVNPIIIRYVAGIATASPVTQAGESLKEPIRQMAAEFYRNTELNDEEIGRPAGSVILGFEKLLTPWIAEYAF